MKIKLTALKQHWQRVKDTWNRRCSQYVEVPPGGCALVFPDSKTYQGMINGLADAKTWTGINYPKKALDKTTFFNN
jgi:hypothetical protein